MSTYFKRNIWQQQSTKFSAKFSASRGGGGASRTGGGGGSGGSGGGGGTNSALDPNYMHSRVPNR